MKKLFIYLHIVLACQVYGSNYFIENKGQWDSRIQFQATLSKGIYLYIENDGFTFNLMDLSKYSSHEKIGNDNLINGHAFKISFDKINVGTRPQGENVLSTYNNYFIGNDSSQWTTHVKIFEKVVYKNIYPGISLELYFNNGNFKYDIILDTNAAVQNIKFRYEGLDNMFCDQNGNMHLANSVNNIIEEKPYSYQIINGVKKEVVSNYILDNNIVSYSFPKGYNPNVKLCIDPVFIGATYSRANDYFYCESVSYDKENNVYVMAQDIQPGDYPASLGAYQVSNAGGLDMVVIKYNPDCSQRFFGTYIGGNNEDKPISMIEDRDTLVFMANTYSDNFPMPSSTFNTGYNGQLELVILKFSIDGDDLYASTYIGLDEDDGMEYGDIIKALDGSYTVVTNTSSLLLVDLIGTMHNNYLGGSQDGLVLNLSSDLKNVNWGIFLGGGSTDMLKRVRQDNNGDYVVVGYTMSDNVLTTSNAQFSLSQGGWTDGIIYKLSEDGSQILYASYWGTAEGDEINDVYIDCKNDIYIAAGSGDTSLPVATTNFQLPKARAVIQKYTNDLSTILWTTKIGSNNTDESFGPAAIHIDSIGRIYTFGVWDDFNTLDGSAFPLTPDAFQDSANPGSLYLMVLEKDADSLLYGSFYGGDGPSHFHSGVSKFNSNARAYVGICTFARDLQTTPGGAYCDTNYTYDYDAVPVVFDLKIQISKVAQNIQAVLSDTCPPAIVSLSNNPLFDSLIWIIESSILTGNNLNYEYTESGMYTIKNISYANCAYDTNDISFTIYDCKIDSDSITVNEIETYLFIPNGFSPNNDFINDYFGVKTNIKYSAYALKIYDKKGKLVFASNAPNETWNGSDNLFSSENAVFTYLLMIETVTGNILNYKGSVMCVK